MPVDGWLSYQTQRRVPPIVCSARACRSSSSGAACNDAAVVGWRSLSIAGFLTSGLAFVLFQAYGEPPGKDFWSVAVPGALTGIGTLALACVTVWLSVSERRRDDRLRDDQRSELHYQRVADKERAQVEREAEQKEAARRDARRVVAIAGTAVFPAVGGNLPVKHTCVVTVINGSDAPILNVILKEGYGSGTPEYGTLVLQPDGGKENAWFQPLILAGQQHAFEALWMDSNGTTIAPADVYFLAGMLRAALEWTDSAGQRWSRAGYDEPIFQSSGQL